MIYPHGDNLFCLSSSPFQCFFCMCIRNITLSSWKRHTSSLPYTYHINHTKPPARRLSLKDKSQLIVVIAFIMKVGRFTSVSHGLPNYQQDASPSFLLVPLLRAPAIFSLDLCCSRHCILSPRKEALQLHVFSVNCVLSSRHIPVAIHFNNMVDGPRFVKNYRLHFPILGEKPFCNLHSSCRVEEFRNSCGRDVGVDKGCSS
jgi:hypothetical protein